MLKTIVAAAVCCAFAASAVAVPLYSENFNAAALDGKGAFGNSIDGVSTDMTGVTTFSIDISGAELDADTTDNWFQVRNSRFEGQDVRGVAVFSTSMIEVTDFVSVDFSLDLGVLGGGATAGSEGIDVSYLLDGSPTSVFSAGIGNPGLPTGLMLSGIDVSSADTFQIRVTIDVDGVDDGFTIDNIIVSGAPFVPEPSSGLLAAFGSAAFVIRNRRRRSVRHGLTQRRSD